MSLLPLLLPIAFWIENQSWFQKILVTSIVPQHSLEAIGH